MFDGNAYTRMAFLPCAICFHWKNISIILNFFAQKSNILLPHVRLEMVVTRKMFATFGATVWLFARVRAHMIL